MTPTRFKNIAALCTAALLAAAFLGAAQTTRADNDPKKPAALTAKQVVQDFEKSLEDPPPEDLGDDPLGTIADKMSDVHVDLSAYKTDQPVQQKENKVVANLDQLIAMLQPRQGSSGGNNPGAGRKKSVIANGEAKIGDLHGVDPRGRQWAQLPPKERDKILQSRTEGFPAGYETLLQSYYQRLSQEKTADLPPDAPPAPAPPASRPASK